MADLVTLLNYSVGLQASWTNFPVVHLISKLFMQTVEEADICLLATSSLKMSSSTMFSLATRKLLFFLSSFYCNCFLFLLTNKPTKPVPDSGLPQFNKAHMHLQFDIPQVDNVLISCCIAKDLGHYRLSILTKIQLSYNFKKSGLSHLCQIRFVGLVIVNSVPVSHSSVPLPSN